MTQVGIKLDKDKAQIFTDTIASSLNGKTKVHRYKVRQLKKQGIALTGRGVVAVFDLIQKQADELNLNGFDDYLPHWKGIIKSSIEAYLLDHFNIDQLPDGETIDEAILRISSQINMSFRAVNIDFFAVGYSEKNQKMGVFLIRTYDDFVEDVCYEPGLFFFHRMEPMEMLMEKIGRIPKTDKDMVKGLRMAYKEDIKQKIKQKDIDGPTYGLFSGGGNIQKTTVYPDGHFTVISVGSMQENGGLKVVGKKKQKRRKRMKA